jgi:hypothetical protein
MTITKTLQFLYTEDAGGIRPYDVDYTVFIFDDGTVRWGHGKEHFHPFTVGDIMTDVQVAALEPFETLPMQGYTQAEIVAW